MSSRPQAPTANDVLSPFGVLMAAYVAYFAFLYTRVHETALFELMQLGTRIIGYRPSALSVLVYAFGAVSLICGFAAGVVLSRRPVRGRQSVTLARLRDTVAAWPVLRRVGVLFAVGTAGWVLGLSAAAAQVVASHGASLFDIASRWEQDPKLVLLAATQILFVPMMLVSARGRWQTALAWVAFAVSVAGLGLLGARNLPAKLVVSAFLALGFILKPAKLVRIALVLAVVLVAVIGVVGAISKAGIYDSAATSDLAVALVYSDSVGAVYNFDRIVGLTPSTGAFGGRLARDSVLAGIPGVDADYANYQIGAYLGGRSKFVIGEETIERSVSLSPTLVGAAYADWGVPGVAGQMLLLGLLLGYLQDRSRTALWLVPFLVTFAAYAINGVNAGVHNPQAIGMTVVALAALVADLSFGRRVPAVATQEEEKACAD